MSYWLRVFFRSVGGRSDASLRSVDECAACMGTCFRSAEVQEYRSADDSFANSRTHELLNTNSQDKYPYSTRPQILPVVRMTETE